MKAPALLGLFLIFVVLINPSGTARSEEPPGTGRGAQAAMATAFTYQGFLKQGGSPVSSSCDLQFSLWDDVSAGTQVGSTLTSAGVGVGNGLFTVSLDFGASPFGGEARWLGTSVRCPAGAGEYTPLAPRQALTAAPYALYATSAATAGQRPLVGAHRHPGGVCRRGGQ